MLLDFNQICDKYGLNVKGVIHIGGHHGQENVIYFEPLKKNFDVLKNNVPSNRIIHNLALGNECKLVEMYVENINQGMSSSILKPKLHIEQYPHIVFNEKETVQMDKLDNIQFNREDYNLINIDVQGYELEAFKGSEKTLKEIDYIISEINREMLYEDCTLITDLKNYLHKFGFELVEENWAGSSWGDGLFIKVK
jgi:FkbM family methyltransferase